MISLCLPTRGRPELFARMVASAFDLADDRGQVEVVYRTAYDDPRQQVYGVPPFASWLGSSTHGPVIQIQGDNIWNTKAWNECAQAARGPIYMQASDDLVFRTPAWDARIVEAFESVPDRIALVHCADGSWHDTARLRGYGPGERVETFAAHVILHQHWLDAVGYLVPPFLVSDHCDTWVNELADLLGRRVFLEDVLVEHMHPVWGKREYDDTDRVRDLAHIQTEPERVYQQLQQRRAEDLFKLQAAISAAASEREGVL